MRGSWKPIAALIAIVATCVALIPTGSAAHGALTDESGDTAPLHFRYIARLERGEAAIAKAKTELDSADAQKAPADDALAKLVLNLERQNAAYGYREAIRQQQVDMLAVATHIEITDAVIRDSPPGLGAVLRDTVGAWLSIWRLAGIDEFNLVRIHPRPLGTAAPSAALLGYYQSSAAQYQLDWTILASINFIESDFGRVNGPSSAGALGPMQFLPSSWTAYGSGGDVNNPKDAIEAAARYLFLSGARRNIDTAIFAYNHDNDYVAAVRYYADAIRRDPAWLDRLYYWNTFG